MVGYSFTYIYYNMILNRCKATVRLKFRNYSFENQHWGTTKFDKIEETGEITLPASLY